MRPCILCSPVRGSKTSPITYGLVRLSTLLRGYLCVHSRYNLAVGVAPLQVTLSSRLAWARYQSPAGFSLHDAQSGHHGQDLKRERPPLLT